MFEPWIYLPRLQNILDAEDIVSVEIEYLLMPQSKGPEILQTNQEALTWLFENLEDTLRGMNPNFRVAWESFNLSGHSFGARMAFYTLFTIPLHPRKPHDLRVKTLHGRSPLLENYTRLPGNYMGVAISQVEANTRATTLRSKMRDLEQGRYIVVKRSGSTPPDGMVAAHCTSVSDAEGATWFDFWGCATMYDLLVTATALPEGVKIFLEHGTADINVPWEHTVRAAEMLKAKFPTLDVSYVLHDGMDHGWDYNRDPSELKGFFDSY